MEWTTDKPTKPGWYWIHGDHMLLRHHKGPFAVLVSMYSGDLVFTVPFMDYTDPVWHETDGLRWYGPIEPPALP